MGVLTRLQQLGVYYPKLHCTVLKWIFVQKANQGGREKLDSLTIPVTEKSNNFSLFSWVQLQRYCKKLFFCDRELWQWFFFFGTFLIAHSHCTHCWVEINTCSCFNRKWWMVPLLAQLSVNKINVACINFVVTAITTIAFESQLCTKAEKLWTAILPFSWRGLEAKCKFAPCLPWAKGKL